MSDDIDDLHDPIYHMWDVGHSFNLLVSGKNFSITTYVMSDDIDDIQDPRYHMRRRTFFLTC